MTASSCAMNSVTALQSWGGSSIRPSSQLQRHTHQQFGEQIKETVDRARESDVAGKVEEGVLMGLRELNAEVSRFVDSVESTETAEAEAEADPENRKR